MSGLAALREPGAVVFDLDGTLVDTVGARIDAWLRTFADEDVPADREHVAALIGSDGKYLAREIFARAGRELSPEDAERIDQRSGEIFDAIVGEPRPTPGAHALLTALAGSQLAWAMATSSRPEQVEPSIRALALESDPLIVDGSHVEHAKPDPDLLLLAAEQLGRPAAECWYVGDSTWDMRAAVAARMTAVGVTYGAAGSADLQNAGAAAVTSLDELRAELARRGLIEAGAN